MSIKLSNTIDFISLDNDKQTVKLTISDEMMWNDEDSHLMLLQEKLNYYLSFIESGEVYDSFPKSTGKLFRIQVMFQYKPSLEACKFLEKVESAIEGAGFKFIYTEL